MSGAKEPGEGVFSHQAVDPLLCLVECVGTQRVHHAQQRLPSLSVQVYLKRKRVMKRCLNYSLLLLMHITKSESTLPPVLILLVVFILHSSLHSPPAAPQG